MLRTLLVLSALAAPSGELAPRLENLSYQISRLEVIEVEKDAQAEKDSRIAGLTERIEAGTEDPEVVDAIYMDLDVLRDWLLAHAVDRPRLPEGQFHDQADAVVLETPELAVTLRKDDLALTVKTDKAAWRFEPSSDADVERRGDVTFSLASARAQKVEEFTTGFSRGFVVRLSDFPEAPELDLALGFHVIGNEMLVETVAAEDIQDLVEIRWPKAVVSEDPAAEMAVIPNMQGILVPGDWPEELARKELLYGRALYMPWWGQLRDGAGVQTIIESQYDAGVEYTHPAGGPTRIEPRWVSSLAQLRYPRIIRLVFDDDATYVTMAKHYRRYVQENGDFLTLEQKRLANPHVDEVIGRPVIHTGALYHTRPGSRFYRTDNMERMHRLRTFDEVAEELRSIKAKGIEDAYVHLDGWGFAGYDNRHPDIIPPGPEQGGWEGMRKLADTCQELGYLFAVHDQYRDYYFNAVSFDERMAVRKWDGSRDEHAEWAGSHQTFLNPVFAPEYVRRNHDALWENGVKTQGAYLDVFAVIPLEESFSPTHPTTREDCAKYRSECLDLLRARGYVVSSEEPAAYLVPSLDLVHHGPYPTQPKGYGPGKGVAIAVPLFNLVYHDALLIPWYLTDDGGWGIPDGEAGWIHAMLNGGLPYVSPGYDEEKMARVLRVAEHARRVGTAEMVSHEFLDDTRRKQRTVFSNGVVVTADFDAGTVEVTENN